MSKRSPQAVDHKLDDARFRQIAAPFQQWLSRTVGAENVRLYVWDEALTHSLPVWDTISARDFDADFERALASLVDQALSTGEKRFLARVKKDPIFGPLAPKDLSRIVLLPYLALGNIPLGALVIFNASERRLNTYRSTLDLLATPMLLSLRSFLELRYLTVQNRELQRSRENLVSLLKEVEQRRFAIEHLTREIDQRAKEQEALRAIAGAASESLHIHEMLQNALDKVLEVTGRERGTIRLKDPATGEILLSAHRGFSEEEMEILRQNVPHQISEQIFASGEPVVVNDRKDLRNTQSLLPQSRSVAWIPIKARQHVVGVLGVSASQPVPFAAREVDLLQAVGNVIGVAIENVRLLEETQRQEEIQRLLKELSQDITSLDIDALFRKVADKVREFFKVDVSEIRLLEGSGVRSLAGGSGVEAMRLSKLTEIRGRAEWIVKHRRPLIIPDMAKQSGALGGGTVFRLGIRGYLAVPLFSRNGEVIGILRALTYEPREFSQAEIDLLQQLANGTAIALANARLFDETGRRARELAALHAVTAAVSGSFDLDQILLKGLDAVLEVTEMEAGYVQFLAGDPPELVIKAHRGMSPSFIASFHGKIRPGGKTEQIVATKEPLVIEDISPGQAERFRDEKIATAAWVPILSKEKVIGVLTIGSRTKRTFPQDKLPLLASIGNALSAALENARLFDETGRRARELAALHVVTAAVSGSLNLEQILLKGLDAVLEATEMEAGYILFFSEEPPEIVIKAHRGMSASFIANFSRRIRPDGKIQQIMATKKPVVLEDIPPDYAGRFRGEKITAAAWVPIQSKEKVIGILAMGSRTKGKFPQDKLPLLASIGNALSAALESARLFEETQRRAHEQAVLNAIATATSQSLRLDELLQIALDKVLEVTGREQGYIRLKDPVTGNLTLVAHRGISEKFVQTLLYERTPGGKSDQVFQSGEPLVINDTEGSLLKEQTRREGSRSMSWFPLKVRGTAVGIMNVSTTRVIPFPSREVELLKAIGNVIGVALENARLFETTERNLDRIRALREIDQAISSTLDMPTVLKVLLEKIDLVFPYSAATVRLLKKEDGMLEPVACRNLDESEWKTAEWRGGRGIANVVFETQAPLIIHDCQNDSRVLDMDFYRKHKLTSYVGVPLIVKDEALGVLGCYTKELHEFTGEEVDFLSAMAARAAVAIHNSQLYEEGRVREKQLEEINRMLSALHTVAAAASQSLDLNRVLRSVIEKITDIFRFDATQIHLYDERTDELLLRAYLEKSANLFASVQSFRRGQGIVGKVAECGQPLIFEDLATDPLYPQLSRTKVSSRFGFRFFAVFPIRGKLKNLGTLACTGLEPRKLNSGEVQLLESMADQIAVAIENSELYEQVRQKVQELQQKTEELERANKVKDEFLSVMSHELRTPLNVVAGYAGVLREGMLGQTNPEQAQALAKIMNRTNDLFGMITSMLYATSIVANEVRIESSPFDLGIFLEELKTFHKNRIQKAVALEWDYPAELPVMTSDREKLRYLLQTLIDNAIKFTEKGRVTLSVRVIENRTESAASRPAECSPAADRLLLTGRQWLEVKVADTGIGIADEKLPIIFEKFRQADSSETRLYGGVGLGLYIAKNFTELLGGKIEVETGAGVGSVFTVTIPCTIVPATPETGRAQNPREAERRDRPDVSLIRTERI